MAGHIWMFLRCLRWRNTSNLNVCTTHPSLDLTAGVVRRQNTYGPHDNILGWQGLLWTCRTSSNSNGGGGGGCSSCTSTSTTSSNREATATAATPAAARYLHRSVALFEDRYGDLFARHLCTGCSCMWLDLHSLQRLLLLTLQALSGNARTDV